MHTPLTLLIPIINELVKSLSIPSKWGKCKICVHCRHSHNWTFTLPRVPNIPIWPLSFSVGNIAAATARTGYFVQRWEFVHEGRTRGYERLTPVRPQRACAPLNIHTHNLYTHTRTRTRAHTSIIIMPIAGEIQYWQSIIVRTFTHVTNGREECTSRGWHKYHSLSITNYFFITSFIFLCTNKNNVILHIIKFKIHTIINYKKYADSFINDRYLMQIIKRLYF